MERRVNVQTGWERKIQSETEKWLLAAAGSVRRSALTPGVQQRSGPWLSFPEMSISAVNFILSWLTHTNREVVRQGQEVNVKSIMKKAWDVTRGSEHDHLSAATISLLLRLCPCLPHIFCLQDKTSVCGPTSLLSCSYSYLVIDPFLYVTLLSDS